MSQNPHTPARPKDGAKLVFKFSNRSLRTPEYHQHQGYFDYILGLQKSLIPTFEETKHFLRDVYLGRMPLPLSPENLAKSYAFFGGANYKATLHKILSDQTLAFNLIPALKTIHSKEPFDLERLRNFVCHEEKETDLETLKQTLHIHNQKALMALEEFYQNPEVVLSALKSTSKKAWGSFLVKNPTNPHLLKATAKLSSAEFFANGMHLAFLEIEPEIYGAFKPTATPFLQSGFRVRKHLKLLLENELEFKILSEKMLAEQKYKDDAKLYKKEEEQAPLAETLPPVAKPAVHIQPKTSEPKPAVNAPVYAQAEKVKEVKPTATPEISAPTANAVNVETKQEAEAVPTKQAEQLSKISLELPEERPSFIQQLIREELGYNMPVGRIQVQRILEAAEAILTQTPENPRPSDFLHNKHPEPREEKITLGTMDLSTR